MASKRKTISAVIAVALAAAILMGGTFAWQSISQEALNEVGATVNPGGRLHDDFHELTYSEDGDLATDPETGKAYETRTFDKNVYVENFTTWWEDGVQVFARIRLDEYMEIGLGAGENAMDYAERTGEEKTATPLVYGTMLDDKNTWTTHIPGNDVDPFHEYWDWTMAGQGEDGTLGAEEAEAVCYMPTFNKNKDSLEADVNGTFRGPDGLYTTRDDAFKDYVAYAMESTPGGKVLDEKTAIAVYDNDLDDVDEIVRDNISVEYAEQCGYVVTKEEDHDTKETLTSTVITMEQWKALPVEEKTGDFWVWDTDGWAYWANPIDPDTATGLFLDGIARTKTIINEDWYYGINVVAQFVTADDLGRDDSTGFYADGETVSFEALQLLEAIGVKVNTVATTAEELNEALALGGNIAVAGEVTSTEATAFGNATADFIWASGGTLTGGNLVAMQNADAGVLINSENDQPNAGDGANAATMSNTAIRALSTDYALYIRAIDNDVTVNDVTVEAHNGGVYAEGSNGGKVTLNNVTVTANSNHSDDWVNAAVVAANGADVVVNGGSYTGRYAAYVYSSGGTITINGGEFYGMLMGNVDQLVIKGGTFDNDPSAFVAEGYEVAETVTDGVTRWTVSQWQA